METDYAYGGTLKFFWSLLCQTTFALTDSLLMIQRKRVFLKKKGNDFMALNNTCLNQHETQ